MRLRQFVREYLDFSRKDRIGVLVLVSIIAGVFFLPEFFRSRDSSSPLLISDTTIISFQEKPGESNPTGKGYEDSQTENSYYSYDRTQSNNRRIRGDLFPFDPNTLSEAGWKKLGLREKTIQTIRNYLARGGRFRIPEDIQKVYGLYPDEYERLRPYVNIPVPREKKADYSIYQEKDSKAQTKREWSLPGAIDINSADTTAFISLPGIGSKLAGRIINFRDKLGGFYSIVQLTEVFGLRDSTYQIIKPYLKLENISVRKLNINTATVDELKAHPYLKYSIANPLVAYRNEHGPFTKIEDIRKVMVVTADVFSKIEPYLNLQ